MDNIKEIDKLKEIFEAYKSTLKNDLINRSIIDNQQNDIENNKSIRDYYSFGGCYEFAYDFQFELNKNDIKNNIVCIIGYSFSEDEYNDIELTIYHCLNEVIIYNNKYYIDIDGFINIDEMLFDYVHFNKKDSVLFFDINNKILLNRDENLFSKDTLEYIKKYFEHNNMIYFGFYNKE